MPLNCNQPLLLRVQILRAALSCLPLAPFPAGRPSELETHHTHSSKPLPSISSNTFPAPPTSTVISFSLLHSVPRAV
ncbi:hypothetical protein LR48_Vigan09g060600 [Vigna angularis]|uniref:Uncharacterized protein n=1 Tax=Phaseolus angularis TaxID=3914 RepID=A0A0L9VAL8_PHAAN|nr:hypothetical protein LR48_Vigan09g060600 [Vigna angularis]